MNTLLISGETIQSWDIESVLTNKVKSKNQLISEMIQYEYDNTIGPYCEGLTYLEIEQLNNLYPIK
jgi:hypothetical protein